MGIFEIISAIILIIACVFIVIVVLMQDTKTQMSQTISGNTGDNYFGKNSGRTKEAMLNKATTTATVIFFVLAVLVNVINVYLGGSNVDDTSSGTTSSVTESIADDSAADSSDDVSSDAESSAAESDTSPAESGTESQPEADSQADSSSAE